MKTAFILMLSLLIGAPSLSTHELTGVWEIPEEKVHVEIKQDGDSYNGVIIRSKVEAAIGKVILRDLTKDKGVYKGQLFAAKHNRMVDVIITPKGDQLELKVSAGIRSRTMYWVRVD